MKGMDRVGRGTPPARVDRPRRPSNHRHPVPSSVAAACLALALAACACAALPARGHYALVNGIRIYYEIHGRGRPLLLLHGGAGDGRQFSNQVPAFSKSFRVIVPDERAQGRSADGPGPLTYHGMAEDVVALLDHLGIRRADVMGWSDGGIIGLDLAIHHPERIDHLVTFGANFHPAGLKSDDREWLSGANAESFGPGSRSEYEKLSPDPGHWETAMNKILAMWRTQPRFALEQLHSIRARTLIAAGDRDLVQPAHTDSLARAIPGARLWIVPDASHGAMLERPELVNRTVLAFLDDRTLP